MKLYPLKLESVNKEIIWGGQLLGEKYNKPKGKLAEAWELAVHSEGICKIANGEYQGMLLSEYLGSEENFPLMIKLIDACDKLSIQVHPVKTEMWYIVEAKEGAKLVYGLADKFDEKTFRSALENGTVEKLLNYTEVHKGDIFFIPQGLVHAIGDGILIAEIQENSNVTYRVYDYGRLQNGKPRQLHVEEAINTIRDFTEEEISALRYSEGRHSENCLASCKSFTTYKYEVKDKLILSADKNFVSVICLDGEGSIDGESFKKGDSYFIPKGYGEFTVNSEGCEIVVSTV
ncbi:MAG: mannose-6-phosphate isomerase [Clostridia bacterium]|nr:mannose-6-phosphate isomerase [Clostridia bacterium]